MAKKQASAAAKAKKKPVRAPEKHRSVPPRVDSVRFVSRPRTNEEVTFARVFF
jgi:hypothetical protein